MPIYTLRDETKPIYTLLDETKPKHLELHLEKVTTFIYDSAGIAVCTPDGHRLIGLTSDGTIRRYARVSKEHGFQLDDRGRIKLEADSDF